MSRCSAGCSSRIAGESSSSVAPSPPAGATPASAGSAATPVAAVASEDAGAAAAEPSCAGSRSLKSDASQLACRGRRVWRAHGRAVEEQCADETSCAAALLRIAVQRRENGTLLRCCGDAARTRAYSLASLLSAAQRVQRRRQRCLVWAAALPLRAPSRR